ncbi:ATP-binding protein [Amycolatopsis sp. NPDC048633]|uniref:ATP-binding protein n=1 Tax=Amycolatopsis sp. NPDC048633 TaxID=3157095 RepID=UPI0033F7043D
MLVSPDPQELLNAWMLRSQENPASTVREFLLAHPAFSTTELTNDHLDLPIGRVSMRSVAPGTDVPTCLPPGLPPPGQWGAASSGPAVSEPPSRDIGDAEFVTAVVDVPPGHPEELTEKEATLRAHDDELNAAAGYLNNGLSVLVRCEKLLVEHLAAEVALRSLRPKHMVRVGGQDALPSLNPAGANPLAGARRAAVLAELDHMLAKAPLGDVIVIPHLDLLAGGNDASLSSEAREVTDLLYEHSGAVLLGFVDPSLVLHEVLANRFAVRLAIDILPREIKGADGSPVPIGRALVTRREAEMFSGFDADELYKHVAGMNAVRLRHALRYSAQHYRDNRPAAGGAGEQATFAALLQELRLFKARTSTGSFEVPSVPFDAIGGYDDVKADLSEALDIVGGSVDLPQHLRHDLVPRGFVLHGPPGTGKTLFAKAIATRLRGTIQVVSGPEITDMYVGESERKLRELFAEARRNAPAVLVFDEFDSIAGQRTGRDDGGSRAGNAIVAQLLTELDGFRPEVPVIIVGTTNRIDLIDVALLRPSRFRPIKIDLPNQAARHEIARWHAKHFGVPAGEQLLASVARATESLNGDEIRSVFRDARAAQLVGERRGLPIEPERIGELVGTLLRARQQQDIDRTGAGPRGRTTGNTGDRRWVPLSTGRPATDAIRDTQDHSVAELTVDVPNDDTRRNND